MPRPDSYREATKGIECTPGVCGGEPCVAGTRIPVKVLEQWRRLGMSMEDILRNYPSLHEDDVRNAWKYADATRYPDASIQYIQMMMTIGRETKEEEADDE